MLKPSVRFPPQPPRRPARNPPDPPPPSPAPPFPRRFRANRRRIARRRFKMPPRRRPRSSTGFLGVRLRDSGRYAAEIAVDGVRWWMGTFDMPEFAARAYDYGAWTFGRPRAEMNFPDVRNLAEAQFLSPPVRMVTREQEKESRRAFLQIRARDLDEAAMEKIHREQPELVQFEREYFAAREAAKKKAEAAAAAAAASEAGPSTTDISSGSSSELDSDFWNDLTSSDDDEF